MCQRVCQHKKLSIHQVRGTFRVKRVGGSSICASLSTSLLSMDILASWCALCAGLSGRTTVLLSSVITPARFVTIDHRGAGQDKDTVSFTVLYYESSECLKPVLLLVFEVNSSASSEGKTFALINAVTHFRMTIILPRVGILRSMTRFHQFVQANFFKQIDAHPI